jgi:hypothetical protein
MGVLESISFARDPTLADELAAFGGDDVVEMTYLEEKDTGVAGVIFISTEMGSHGPRVKYFTKTGRNQPSFSVSISDEPVVVASTLPERTLKRAAPAVIRWVKLNQEALLRFWNEGESMSVDELHEFAKSLKKI